MILGHSELAKLIKSKKIIEGLSERDKKGPEGCVFDLQLEKVFLRGFQSQRKSGENKAKSHLNSQCSNNCEYYDFGESEN
jgi:hypothetical protein